MQKVGVTVPCLDQTDHFIRHNVTKFRLIDEKRTEAIPFILGFINISGRYTTSGVIHQSHLLCLSKFCSIISFIVTKASFMLDVSEGCTMLVGTRSDTATVGRRHGDYRG